MPWSDGPSESRWCWPCGRTGWPRSRAYPGFARLLERGLHLLGAMSEQGLREAVQAPARQAGLLIEAGLVDLLVGEVEGTPGALPMLSHALLETWKRREGNTLTVAGYTATGGIRRAVAQTAEQVYATIDPEHRQMLRDLVLRLVTAGAEGEPVRSRVPRRLLSGDPAHEHLIDLLVASRLVTSDAGIVEIAHEALARAWPRLSAWLDEDVEGQRILHHLSGSADAWNSMGRPDSELYRGARATQALQWKARQDTTLTDTEVAFLEATERAEQSEQRGGRAARPRSGAPDPPVARGARGRHVSCSSSPLLREGSPSSRSARPKTTPPRRSRRRPPPRPAGSGRWP